MFFIQSVTRYLRKFFRRRYRVIISLLKLPLPVFIFAHLKGYGIYAVYWAEKNIRVNSITPGGVHDGQQPGFVSNYCNRTPMARMADKKDLQGGFSTWPQTPQLTLPATTWSWTAGGQCGNKCNINLLVIFI